MNAKTLASIFSTIPSSVRFPWDAALDEHGAFVRKLLMADDAHSDGEEGDLLHQLLRSERESHEDDELTPSEGDHVFSGLLSTTGDDGVDLREAERAAAFERAKHEHEQRIQSTIEATRAQAAASSVAIKAQRQVSGHTKRPRPSGPKMDRSDPDVQKLDAVIESNAALVARWETNRDALTADEQEALLLIPGEEEREVSGAVCLFHVAKGYGFIAPDCGGPDIYFTREAINYSDVAKDIMRESNSGVLGSGVGERVVFKVSLNESHSTRRLKAEGVRPEGNGSEPAIVVALRGRKFNGRVRNFNMDINKGYIQNTKNDSGDELTAAFAEGSGTTNGAGTNEQSAILQRCHTKGIIDAAFSLTAAQMSQGVIPVSGTDVEYYLMPSLDTKSGRAVAVGCSFLIAPSSAVSHGPVVGSAMSADGSDATLKRLRVESGDMFSMPSPALGHGVSFPAGISQDNNQHSAAPRLLLLDETEEW